MTMNEKKNLDSPLHYLASGLDNVYLINGFRYAKTQNDEDILIIQDLDGLHLAIAMAIADSSLPLDAKTFKYLRKHLDMAQRGIADLLGMSEDMVSKWERATNPIPKTADLILKTLVKEKRSRNAELMRLIERYNVLDREAHEVMLRLAIQEDKWTMAA